MPDTPKPNTPAEAKDLKDQKGTPVQEVIENLKQVERTTGGSGAIPLTPKQMMLDASSVEARHPDLKLRWVNIKDPQMAATRIIEGYRRLSAEEGGSAIGDELALFGVSRAQFEAKVERNKRNHEQRMVAHRAEMEQMAEAVARELRDRHGIRVDAGRLLVNEEGR